MKKEFSILVALKLHLHSDTDQNLLQQVGCFKFVLHILNLQMWCDKCFFNINIIIFWTTNLYVIISWYIPERSFYHQFILFRFLLLSLSLTHFKGEEGDDEEEEDDPDYDPSKDKAAKGQQPPECKQQWPSGWM